MTIPYMQRIEAIEAALDAQDPPKSRTARALDLLSAGVSFRVAAARAGINPTTLYRAHVRAKQPKCPTCGRYWRKP